MSITAFWVKGNKIIDTKGQTHIFHVIKNPDVFGLTEQEVNRVYKKHKERLFKEGKAREELIKRVSQNGWIRIREYKEYWSIQFDSFKKRKKVLQDFIYWALVDAKILTKRMPLVLIGFDDGYMERFETSKFLLEHKIDLKEYKKPNFILMYLMTERHNRSASARLIEE